MVEHLPSKQDVAGSNPVSRSTIILQYANMIIFKVYWTDPSGKPNSQDESDLSVALALAEAKRREGMSFVTMVSENPDHVGKPGVAAVENGKTPDGHVYDWSKAGRAGAIRRHERADYVKTNTVKSGDKEVKS